MPAQQDRGAHDQAACLRRMLIGAMHAAPAVVLRPDVTIGACGKGQSLAAELARGVRRMSSALIRALDLKTAPLVEPFGGGRRYRALHPLSWDGTRLRSAPRPARADVPPKDKFNDDLLTFVKNVN